MDYLERAQILSEALPYIQKYKDKTIVVKYGGNAMLSDELKMAVLSDIVLLSFVGLRVVVVHGGGPEINAVLGQMGMEARFVNGLRYTDRETMDVVQMVLCGRTGKDLAAQICQIGGKAVGISGLDCGMMEAVRLAGDVDYGFVGELKRVDPTLVNTILNSGCIPVVSTVAQGVDEQTAYNINADTAAAELAVALGAESLILLTDVRGICKDYKDEETLIPLLHISNIPALIKSGVVSGGMIPKVDCCVQAVRKGVSRATILDGRVRHSLLTELLTDSGFGTMIIGG